MWSNRWPATSTWNWSGCSRRPDGGITAEDVAAAVDERTAVVTLSHIAYHSGYLADAKAITEIAHQAGALLVWDLCHSVGSTEIALDDWDVDFAVGCTYKFVGAGPGRTGVHATSTPGTTSTSTSRSGGGSAAGIPSRWSRDIVAAPGIRSMLSGTPAIPGILAVREGAAVIAEAGIRAIRAKAVALTEMVISLTDEWLVPQGFSLGSPRDSARRGAHVSINRPDARQVCAELIEAGVLADFRAPDTIRIGLSPLPTGFTEVWDAMDVIREADGLADAARRHRVRRCCRPTGPGSPGSLIVSFAGSYLRELGGWIAVADLIRCLSSVELSEPSVRQALVRLKSRGFLAAERRVRRGRLPADRRRPARPGHRRPADLPAGDGHRRGRLGAGRVLGAGDRPAPAASTAHRTVLAGIRHGQPRCVDRAAAAGRPHQGAARRCRAGRYVTWFGAQHLTEIDVAAWWDLDALRGAVRERSWPSTDRADADASRPDVTDEQAFAELPAADRRLAAVPPAGPRAARRRCCPPTGRPGPRGNSSTGCASQLVGGRAAATSAPSPAG